VTKRGGWADRGWADRVVAEGIETPAQETLLREMGCQFGQGFYYRRPAPGPEIAATLSQAAG
jgi:EAL domain-containing protein (putative c-di-GMP-specific phosphodiesterase class I)